MNLKPYLWKTVFQSKNGYTTLGFPFSFHRQGGFGVYEFRYWAALVDAAVALIAAVGVGRRCARRRREKGWMTEGRHRTLWAVKPRIVPDGAVRQRECPKHQARLLELRASIEARHAAALASAGLVRRLMIRWRIAAEFRRERRALEPSRASLHARAFEAVGRR